MRIMKIAQHVIWGFVSWICILCLSAGVFAADVAELRKQADALVERGKFTDASQLIRRAMQGAPEGGVERATLNSDLARLDRIKRDYPLSEGELFSRLKESVKNLRWNEYQTWIREGWFDHRMVEGERKFMVSSVSNLFFRHHELNERRLSEPRTSAAYERKLLETVRKIRASAGFEEKPYVLPKTFRVRMMLNVKPDAASDGEIVRAWLPIPREYPFQGGFKLLESRPPVRALATEDSPIRSAYFETRHNEKEPAEFVLQYEYTTRGVWFGVDEGKATRSVTNRAAFAYTNAGPHISFGPRVRELAQQIAGAETNSWVKARRFYNWIAERIQYSFAVEYSTIRNITEHCLERGYGDCGQEALLFISLCRLNGIPARWQSGWSIFPDAQTIHDWTEIYIEPYGWVPVDPYMGIFAMQYAQHLTIWEKMELRDFYFGGLDQYRLIANGDHCQQLAPPKRSIRSDDVDFQRGEVESGGRNIYFDQFDYKLDAKELKAQPSSITQ